MSSYTIVPMYRYILLYLNTCNHKNIIWWGSNDLETCTISIVKNIVINIILSMTNFKVVTVEIINSTPCEWDRIEAFKFICRPRCHHDDVNTTELNFALTIAAGHRTALVILEPTLWKDVCVCMCLVSSCACVCASFWPCSRDKIYWDWYVVGSVVGVVGSVWAW